MNGFDENDKKDAFDRYIDMQLSSENDNKAQKTNSGNNDFRIHGLRCVVIVIVIVIVVILLISLIASGGDWKAIDSLLAFGFIAFLLLNR